MVYALTKMVSLTDIAGMLHPVGMAVCRFDETDCLGRREKA
jgi:hypothetical protein